MISELFAKQRLLLTAGAISFALFLVLAVVSLVDATEITGVNRWIKPMKFTLSPAIYLWTLAVYLFFVEGKEWSKRIIAGGAAAMMAGEIALVILQAARGTASHFNIKTPFDAAVFQAMGVMIVINTILIFFLLGLYFRAKINLPGSIIWGMRLGIVLFILAGLEGFVMTSALRHSVGVADGGAGLPFVNWSTEGGDLRVAHFIGMHALQAIPLFAYGAERYRAKSALLATVIFALAYSAVAVFTFLQAMSGKPLFGVLFGG